MALVKNTCCSSRRPGPDPGTYIGLLTSACNSNPRESNTIFCTLRAHVHTHAHTLKTKTNLKN